MDDAASGRRRKAAARSLKKARAHLNQTQQVNRLLDKINSLEDDSHLLIIEHCSCSHRRSVCGGCLLRPAGPERKGGGEAEGGGRGEEIEEVEDDDMMMKMRRRRSSVISVISSYLSTIQVL